MSRSKRSKASPRRKAGSKASKKNRIVTFRLVVEAQEMRVSFRPDEGRGEYRLGKFEFKSPHKPPRRIAISETGYRCHFAPMADVKEAGSPQDYAREYLLSCLNAGRAKTGVSPNQLALF